MIRFFTSHDASDVGWAVAVLRRALGLPIDAPGNCRMSRTADCVIVTLPPDDIWRCHKPLVVAAVAVSLFTVWNTIRGGTLFDPIGPVVVVLPAWVVKDASIVVCLSLMKRSAPAPDRR
jgi:hypothetical protein